MPPTKKAQPGTLEHRAAELIAALEEFRRDAAEDGDRESEIRAKRALREFVPE